MQAGRNKRLIFRSYLIIVLGIVIFGLLLDYLLARNFNTNHSETYQSTQKILSNLVASRLSQGSFEDLQSAAAEIELEINTPVDLLSIEDVALMNSDQLEQNINSTGSIGYTENNQPIFYFHLPQHQTVVTFGPLASTAIKSHDWFQRLVPILFYSFVLGLVWIWIRPLLRDLDLLSDAADNIKQDFRHPMPDLKSITTIRPLADGFESMTQQLTALIESQKEFSNAISHEVRTPLARIKFSLAILEKELPASLLDQSSEIHKDVNEIDQLLDAMLKYAQLEHPDTIVAWQSLSVEDLLTLIESKKRSSPIIELTHVVVNPDQLLVCDPHLMVLAVSNLIENAIRYANQKILVSLDITEHDAHITVEDDGTGIPEEQHQTVIKAFSSIHVGDDAKSGGYGLGLAIVNRIANLHNGNLEIGSAELGGAKMHIYWPLIYQPIKDIQQNVNRN